MSLLSSIFNKSKKFDANKKYISLDDKRYDEQSLLNQKELLEIFIKYKDYDKKIDIKDSKKVDQVVHELMSELFNLKILCKNYNEFDCWRKNVTKNDVESYNILQCMALITGIQRKDYWSGGLEYVYTECTDSGILPCLINRIIDLFG